MRILHVVHTPRYSGAEMLVLALTKLHVGMGHASAVVAMFPTETDFDVMVAEQQKSGVEWIVPMKKLGRIARLAHLHKASRRFKPDVVFAHSVLPAAYARVGGLPNVISVLHDASENDYGSERIAIAERGLQYFSKGVIAVSPRASINYSARYKIPPVVCIPNGIALAIYQNAKLKDRTELLSSLGLPEDAIVAIQVGRITGIKQQYLSVRAMAPLIAKNPKIHMLLAGIYEDSGSLFALQAEIQTHNLAKNVHLIGPRDDIPILLQLANVYLMPSKQEAHSVALIEALASGVGIVAADIPPFEYARQMNGVTLVNPNISHLFGLAINAAFENESRFDRNLVQYDIVNSANQYLRFAEACLLEN